MSIIKYLRSIENNSIDIKDFDQSKLSELMVKSDSGALFITSNNKLYGIITMGDVRKSSSNINTNPVYIHQEDSVVFAFNKMLDNKITILPVIDGSGALIGYLCIQDLLSPERICISDTEKCTDSNHVRHITRYKFASMFLNNGLTIDCACGSGYGSKILSDKSDQVHAIDSSFEAIEYARSYNNLSNIYYIYQELQSLEYDQNTVQSIVSLETLEHIHKNDMLEFLTKSAGWLKKGGCFIGSSPMLRYRNGKPYITNPYHINELPRNELLKIIKHCFKGFKICFFHQDEYGIKLLVNEKTGFCIFIARKK